MTYKQFIKDMREQADLLEALVKDSQLISMRDEIAEDDSFLDAYASAVEELVDNATGLHGHTIEWRKA